MKILKRALLILALGACVFLMAGGVQFFWTKPKRFSITVYSEAPRGCELKLAMQERGIFSWGVPLHGGNPMRCGELADIDESLSVSCQCAAPHGGMTVPPGEPDTRREAPDSGLR